MVQVPHLRPPAGNLLRHEGGWQVEMTGRSLTLDVSGHGHTAVVLDGVGPYDVAIHRAAKPVPDGASTFHFDDRTPVGKVRGMLLARPDGNGFDAYVQSTCATPATLRHSVDGGRTWTEDRKEVHPAEWTVPVPTGTVQYQVISGPARTETVELADPRPREPAPSPDRKLR